MEASFTCFHAVRNVDYISKKKKKKLIDLLLTILPSDLFSELQLG